jgi:hypothetical protein
MYRLKPFITFMLVLVFLLQNTIASAQDTVNLYLSEPIIESFPQVKMFLQVHDEIGQPINDIPINAFSILEDNQAAVDVAVAQVEVGTRLVYAINTSPALRIRDTLGRSRFDLVRTALLAWFALPEHATMALDEYSLITSEGMQLETSSASADIASLLANLETPFELEGDYELLFRALDVTNEPARIVGMPSYIFFITPLLRPSLDIPLESIISRARASQTSIYPILVGPPDIVEQSEVESFELLATETGGVLTFFDPDQGLLELAQKMIELRTQYQFTYRSLATTSGPHEINIQLSSDGIEAVSQPRSFILELLEPEITLLNLPPNIQRKSDDPSTALESIPPTFQDVEFVVEFPDNYPRPIVQSQLLVDGEIIEQKLQEPFSPLTWDLRNVLNDSTASVQVTVMDSLGYQSTSPISEISLKVELPPRGLAAVRPALSSLLIALGVLLGGVALAALLLTMGRRSSSLSPSTPSTAAVQPTPIPKTRQELPDEPIEAYLYPLKGDQDSPGTIYLTGTEISIGRDPNFAAVPIDDLSVEGLHARIIRQVDGSYILRDQGSKAGTWIQYHQIPTAGQKLSHGDIVHFGRSGYRFVFDKPPPEKEIRITRTSELDGPTEGNTS